MLTLDPPPLLVGGVTVFRDHEDPELFYYLPPAPRLARDGDALAFSLRKYRRDLTDNPALDPTRARGGGIAHYTTECVQGGIDRLRGRVASAAERPDARLLPAPLRRGTVRAILARREGDRLIEDLVETRPAPLSAPHRALFALALTAEGAALVEGAARGGELPAGVAYEFTFLALAPSLHARVTMDYEHCYDRFAASIGFHYYVGLELDADLQWLREHDFIKVEILSFGDEADRDRQQRLVMDLVRARVAADFFRPTLPPHPDGGLTGPLAQLLGGVLGGEATSATALFVLKAKYEMEHVRKDFELVFDGRAAVELTHVAAGTLSTMRAEDAPPLRIDEIDLDDPFFSSLQVDVDAAIDWDAMADLREAIVHVQRGSWRDGFRFTRDDAAPKQFELALTDPRADEYAWHAEYVFDPEAGAGPTRIEGRSQSTRRRALVLDPMAHLAYRRVRFHLGPVDAALVPRIHVRVRARTDDEEVGRADLLLDGAHPEAVLRLRLRLGGPEARVWARADWEDARGEVHAGEDALVTGASFVALGPFRDLLTVLVQAAVDWSRVTQIAGELRHEDEQVIERRFVFTAAAAGGQTVAIPLRDPSRRRYRWRQILLRADGTGEETEWAESDATLLVLRDRAPAPREVRVVWVGAPGDALGLRVDFFVVGAEPVGVFLRAGEGEAKATLPPDPDGALSYRFEVRRFRTDGEELIREGESRGNLLVVNA